MAAADSFPVTLHRDREARLAFRAGGTIAAIPVRPGDRLGRGALVATIDATDQAAAVRRAEAEVARLERAAGRYDRLAQAGAVGTAQALDSGSVLAQAQAVLAAARHDLADTRIRMPFAGTVRQRHAEVGEVVGPGSAVATVVDDTAPLLAVADVPVQAAAGLRAGARGWLLLPGQSGPVAATPAARAGCCRSGQRNGADRTAGRSYGGAGQRPDRQSAAGPCRYWGGRAARATMRSLFRPRRCCGSGTARPGST